MHVLLEEGKALGQRGTDLHVLLRREGFTTGAMPQVLLFMDIEKSEAPISFFHPEMSKYCLKLRNNKLILFTKFLSSFSDQHLMFDEKAFGGGKEGGRMLCSVYLIVLNLPYLAQCFVTERTT